MNGIINPVVNKFGYEVIRADKYLIPGQITSQIVELYLYSYIKELQDFTRLSKKLGLSGNNVANDVLKLC